MNLEEDVVMGALQLAQLQRACVYIYHLGDSRAPALSPQPLPTKIPQWRIYPIGQLELHCPVPGANEYFFQTVSRGLKIDLDVLARVG